MARLPCAPIAAQGQYTVTPYAKWADVKNNCARRVHATIQVDRWPDPGCGFIEAGKTVRFTWSLAGGKANYAYDCGG